MRSKLHIEHVGSRYWRLVGCHDNLNHRQINNCDLRTSLRTKYIRYNIKPCLETVRSHPREVAMALKQQVGQDETCATFYIFNNIKKIVQVLQSRMSALNGN